MNFKCICILNQNKLDLAALIASHAYSYQQDSPIFIFPEVSISKSIESTIEINTIIKKSLSLLGNFEYFILGGLDDSQIKNLPFLEDYSCLYVNNFEDINIHLTPIFPKRKDTSIEDCKLALVKSLFNNTLNWNSFKWQLQQQEDIDNTGLIDCLDKLMEYNNNLLLNDFTYEYLEILLSIKHNFKL